MTSAGQLRQVVELQYPSRVASGHGDYTPTWTTKATVRALIEPLGGREFFAADERQAEITTRITIRFYKTVTARWRVKHGNVLYDIKQIMNRQTTDRFLMLLCEEMEGKNV